jgi:hypothetical protein
MPSVSEPVHCWRQPVSEAQDETFSPQNITVLGGLLLIAIILGEVVIGHHGNDEMATESVDTMEDVCARV